MATKKVTVGTILILVFFISSQAQEIIWQGKSNVCSGKNFDVGIRDGIISIISDKYYELDTAGTILFEDETVSDKAQTDWDFGPSITISNDGTAHIITRGQGDKDSGFILLYHSKKTGNNSWTHKNVEVAKPMTRNYVVDIVPAIDNNTVYFAHTFNSNDDVHATIHFYKITNGIVDSLGAFSTTDYIRSDADFRMKVYKDTLHLLTGKPDPNGKIYYMNAKLTDELPQTLENNTKAFTFGKDRKSAPDIAIDSLGDNHIMYGTYYSCNYHRYSNSGKGLIERTTIYHNLNAWHLNCGLGAIGVNPDGQYILTLGLQANGSKVADTCEIHWNLSNDGGVHWTYQKQLGYRTHGGEGRMRPRIVNMGNTFFAFFYDIDNPGLSFQKTTITNPDIQIAATPKFLPEEEEHEEAISVTFENENEFSFFYTFDGSTPGLHSNEYKDGIIPGQNFTDINVMACQPGLFPSYASKTYFVDAPPSTSIKELERNNNMLCRFYPNPCSDMVYVQINNPAKGEVHIEISDIQGKVLKSIYNHKSEAAQQFGINLNGISSHILIVNTLFDGTLYHELILHK